GPARYPGGDSCCPRARHRRPTAPSGRRGPTRTRATCGRRVGASPTRKVAREAPVARRRTARRTSRGRDLGMTVLDASAILALINNEPGADEVAEALPESVLSTVNLAEVIGKLVDAEIDASRV